MEQMVVLRYTVRAFFRAPHTPEPSDDLPCLMMEDDVFRKAFAARLKELRKQKGLTQKDLVQRLGANYQQLKNPSVVCIHCRSINSYHRPRHWR